MATRVPDEWPPQGESPQTEFGLQACSRYTLRMVEPMSEYEFTVVYERDDDGRILAGCPALPGCCADGETEAEAAKNIREAMLAHIESRLKHGEPIYPKVGVERIALAL